MMSWMSDYVMYTLRDEDYGWMVNHGHQLLFFVHVLYWIYCDFHLKYLIRLLIIFDDYDDGEGDDKMIA